MGEMSDMCFEQGWLEAGESWSISREYYRPREYYQPRRYYNPIPLEAWIRLQRGDPTKAFPLDEDEDEDEDETPDYINPMFREEKPMAKIIKSRVDRILLDPASPLANDDRQLIITRSHKMPGSITLYTTGLEENCSFTIPKAERATVLEALKELFKDDECND